MTRTPSASSAATTAPLSTRRAIVRADGQARAFASATDRPDQLAHAERRAAASSAITGFGRTGAAPLRRDRIASE